MNINSSISEKLYILGLSSEEAAVYLELLREPSTHLCLSRSTGINRTKIYRLVEKLEKKSFVFRRTDDRGTFLVASDPETLEMVIVNKEIKLKQQRIALSQLIPQLQALPTIDSRTFTIRTYEGEEGLKQMCWHELKTNGELVSLGGQTIEDLITNHRWAEKHREFSVHARYSIREIINYDIDPLTFTSNQEYMRRYHCRQMPNKQIYFNEQITVYNNTVSIYHWRENQKIGVEIISKTYTTMMRQVFEHYWSIAK